jgi:hypothetical protein
MGISDSFLLRGNQERKREREKEGGKERGQNE